MEKQATRGLRVKVSVLFAASAMSGVPVHFDCSDVREGAHRVWTYWWQTSTTQLWRLVCLPTPVRPKGSHPANLGNARTRKAVKNPGGTATIAGLSK